MVSRGWGGEGNEEYCLMGTEFQFCKMKKVLQIGCTVLTYLTLLTCTLKMAKVRSFMLYIFYRDFKKKKKKKKKARLFQATTAEGKRRQRLAVIPSPEYKEDL